MAGALHEEILRAPAVSGVQPDPRLLHYPDVLIYAPRLRQVPHILFATNVSPLLFVSTVHHVLSVARVPCPGVPHPPDGVRVHVLMTHFPPPAAGVALIPDTGALRTVLHP